MADIFKGFRKEKGYLVCIDSDGCAMDTMDIKHIRCFGPCMISEWGLEAWSGEIQQRWNGINLYSMTRGINRFKGLELALKEVNDRYKKIEGLEELGQWVCQAKELSNHGLKQYLSEKDSNILRKTLKWSEKVNRMIEELPEREIKPFTGVAKVIQAIHRVADIAVVSSANHHAIMEEWEKHGLLQDTDIILSQDAGSKAYCIQRLVEIGYERNHVLMIGDAPGDREAAICNEVLYYPILVKKEKESWSRIRKEGLARFMEGSFEGVYQQKLIREFEENLSK